MKKINVQTKHFLFDKNDLPSYDEETLKENGILDKDDDVLWITITERENDDWVKIEYIGKEDVRQK